jgi:hypothetical protein
MSSLDPTLNSIIDQAYPLDADVIYAALGKLSDISAQQHDSARDIIQSGGVGLGDQLVNKGKQFFESIRPRLSEVICGPEGLHESFDRASLVPLVALGLQNAFNGQSPDTFIVALVTTICLKLGLSYICE